MAKKYWIYKGKKIPVKKYYPKTKKTSEQLYRELVRKTGQANRRISAIKKEFGSLGWSGNKLKEKTEIALIDAWRSRGIKVNKNMSETQMKATLKLLNNFLESKTSTIKGIKKVMREQQENLKTQLEITPEESQTLYSFFSDNDFNFITQYIQASDLFLLLQESKEQNDSTERWLDRVSGYLDYGQDEDLKRALISIYNKYS